ncbi:MAG: acyl-CoA dehydrogenase, partial [Dehalococcoidia bacterium]|nr:acyl-CoA dehydrogenase [Dehalococcoidia bacterium]
DDVRVPSRNIIGEVNGGWAITQATMNYERSSVGIMSGASRGLNELVQYCKETSLRGKPLSQNPHVRHRLAQLAIDIEVGRTLSYRVGWLQEKGDIMAAAAAACGAKVYSTELWQRVAFTGIEIMGLYGTVAKGSKWAVLKGQFENLAQATPGYKLGGGTSEIMRSIVAWVGLGLPRIK